MSRAGAFKWSIVDNVMISCGSGPAPNDKWEEFLSQLETLPITRLLSVTGNAFELNGTQRSRGYEIANARHIPIVVITDERLVRGIVTAASWMGVNAKAFAWSELRDGIRTLQVTPGRVEKVAEAALRLRSECETEAGLAAQKSA